jgi:hypothetical protein
MSKSAAVKKAREANRAMYAPKPKPPTAAPSHKATAHSISDDVLKKIIQRVLVELKIPDKIPSVVLLAALAEVRELVEQAQKQKAEK